MTHYYGTPLEQKFLTSIVILNDDVILTLLLLDNTAALVDIRCCAAFCMYTLILQVYLFIA